ncbi:hypothetical protein LTR10_008377 [Elasticomyces elasticus]|nr:hypothetical protein LTR10_008377 [Elasticomyces elasticus]KAK4967251.1 hypothetical protein LTR42_010600 [Elasticomyces elasticus]
MDALPQELLDHIGGDCDKASLLSLRLVNKELAAALKSTFIERYISKRTHLYSIYGLQKLVDLTAERDLAKHIKEIVLVVHDLHSDLNPDGSGNEGYEYQLYRAETAWLENGGSRAKWQLRKVLRNLEDTNSGVTFAFSKSRFSSHPYGLGIRQQQASIADLAQPNALLEASEAGSEWTVPIWQLDICHNLQYPSFARFRSPFEGFGSMLLTPNWSMLRSLKLYIGYAFWDRNQTLREWNETACWEGFDGFITAAPNLEHVALSWGSLVSASELNEQILVGMGDALGQVRVKSVELGPFLTTRLALIMFLCSQMRSLESIKLVEIGLRTGDGWRRVLKAVAARTDVVRIELNRVWMGEISEITDEIEKNYMVMDENGSEYFVQEGSEAVKSRLVELADSPLFVDKLGAESHLAGEMVSEDEDNE